MALNSITSAQPHRDEPTWEVAYLFPTQGNWSEEDYLALNGNQLIEYSHGILEVLPKPTTSHQMLVLFLYRLLLLHSTANDLGTVVVAPLRVRLWRGKFREPDVVFVLKKNADRVGEEFWDGADLVMEVVSNDPEDWRRDLVTKRREYARAGIDEYWIVDPSEEKIIVLRRSGKRYVVHGEFENDVVASSHLMPGFEVEVRAAFEQATAPVRRPRPRKPRSSS